MKKYETIKSYQEIAESTTHDDAVKLLDEDANYIAENFPQITRHFQYVCTQIGSLENSLNFIKSSLIELNNSLHLLKSLTELHADKNNDTRH
jgi:hypothetical protein